MAEPTSTPRITAQYLDSYVGRNVMLVGKVLQLRGDSAVLDADGNVTAILNRDVHLTNGNAAQVIGKVNPDLSIKKPLSLASRLPIPEQLHSRAEPFCPILHLDRSS
ncbi:Replication factor A protein 3 [Colletotrichum shisoi]|uniref:Replication factor A protein 3 n=1 Tax=Colletotrichum shisoi TaxID=2078593 RepID=A0A5Q4C3L7_9PEZI|nr:Replication factor A protein 3 [Colletotrichum shisoi]